jgi:hypothetical protein
MPDGPRDVARIVAAVEPFDEVERSHQAAVLAWLASTSDVYRRVKPQIGSASPERFDPNLSRFLAKIRPMLG